MGEDEGAWVVTFGFQLEDEGDLPGREERGNSRGVQVRYQRAFERLSARGHLGDSETLREMVGNVERGSHSHRGDRSDRYRQWYKVGAGVGGERRHNEPNASSPRGLVAQSHPVWQCEGMERPPGTPLWSQLSSSCPGETPEDSTGQSGVVWGWSG